MMGKKGVYPAANSHIEKSEIGEGAAGGDESDIRGRG